jgi:hypothetical protein
LWLKLVARKRNAIFGGDGLNGTAGGVDRSAIGRKVTLRTGLDENAIAAKLESSKLRRLVLASLTQRSRNASRGELLSGAHFLRRCEYLRRGREQRSLCESRIHETFVFFVLNPKDNSAKDDEAKEHDQAEAQQLHPETGWRCTDFKFYGHRRNRNCKQQ